MLLFYFDRRCGGDGVCDGSYSLYHSLSLSWRGQRAFEDTSSWYPYQADGRAIRFRTMLTGLEHFV
jgi:hypothetical protein